MSVIANLTAVLAADTVEFDTGMRKAAQVTREMNRDAKAAFQGTMTAQEQFAASSKRLAQLLDAGKISAETHAKAIDKLKAEYTEAQASANRFGSGLSSLKGALATVGIGVGLSETVNFFKSSVAEFENARREQVKLATSLESTGHAAGFTHQALAQYAADLQRLTGIDDDLISGAEGVLATFTKIKGVNFTDAVMAILDVSKKLDQDLQSSAIQVGKALNDPIRGLTALRRVGVSFSAEQEDVIKAFAKTGDIASAQRVILEELKTEFGGTAVAMRTELQGLESDWGNLKEAIGSLAEAEPVKLLLRDIAQEVRGLSKAASEAPDTGWIAVAIEGLRMLSPGYMPPQLRNKADANPVVTAPTPDIASAPSPDMAAATKDTAQLEEAMSKLRAEFDKQHMAVGMSANELKLWQLEAMGADETVLQQARSMLENIDAFKAAAEATKRFEQEQTALIDSLQKEIATFGMTTNEVKLFNLEQAAGPDGIDPMIRALMEERDALQANADAARKAKDEIAAMMDEGKRIHESLLTPTEKYEAELKHLNELFQQGALDEEDMARAAQKAKDELDKAMKKDEKPSRRRGDGEPNRALVWGSPEHFAAINRANEGLNLGAGRQGLVGAREALRLRRQGVDVGNRDKFGRIPRGQRGRRQGAGGATAANVNRVIEKNQQMAYQLQQQQLQVAREQLAEAKNSKVWIAT